MTFNSNCEGKKRIAKFYCKKKKRFHSVAETKKNGIVRYKLRIVGGSQNKIIYSNYDFFFQRTANSYLPIQNFFVRNKVRVVRYKLKIVGKKQCLS